MSKKTSPKNSSKKPKTIGKQSIRETPIRVNFYIHKPIKFKNHHTVIASRPTVIASRPTVTASHPPSSLRAEGEAIHLSSRTT